MQSGSTLSRQTLQVVTKWSPSSYHFGTLLDRLGDPTRPFGDPTPPFGDLTRPFGTLPDHWGTLQDHFWTLPFGNLTRPFGDSRQIGPWTIGPRTVGPWGRNPPTDNIYPPIVGRIYPIPSNWHVFPKCWQLVSNMNIKKSMLRNPTPKGRTLTLWIIFPKCLQFISSTKFYFKMSPTLCPKDSQKPSNWHVNICFS